VLPPNTNQPTNQHKPLSTGARWLTHLLFFVAGDQPAFFQVWAEFKRSELLFIPESSVDCYRETVFFFSTSAPEESAT
jgi:hypothetical protein